MPNDTSSRIENVTVNRAKGIEFPTPTVDDDGKVLVYSHASGTYRLGEVGGEGEGDISIADVTLAGDVTGDAESNTVEKVRGKAVAAPEAGDDGQFARYNHGAGTISWETPPATTSVTMGGDVTGNSGTATVEKIRNLNVPAPVAGDDEKALVYEHTGTPAFKYVTTYVPGGTDVAVADGGTGASTATAGFDNLAPTTTKGDLIVHNGSDNIRVAVGTDGHVLTADAAQASGVKWAVASGGNPPADVNYFRQVGTSPLERYYFAGQLAYVQLVTATGATGTLRAFPFVAPRGGTLDRLVVGVTTSAGAGGVARWGVYQATSATNLYPSALLFDGGEVNMNTATGVTVSANSINLALTAGVLYWFVYIGGVSAATLRGINIGGTWPIFGYSNAFASAGSANIEPGVGLTVAQAYGALPDPYPAGATVIVASAAIPAIGCRFSA